jgi:hypothetical protein
VGFNDAICSPVAQSTAEKLIPACIKQGSAANEFIACCTVFWLKTTIVTHS